MAAARGFGVAGALDHALIEQLAGLVERLGYDSFWANDTPGGEGLAALAAAASATTRVELGVGVIPIDRSSPERIAARVKDLELPVERLIVGVGAGGARQGTITLVRAAVETLRDLTGARVFVGALGPRMCKLAGEVADGVLLNWLTAGAAASSANIVRSAAAEVGRAVPTVAAYVRGALPEGERRFAIEADRYGSYPQYAANFNRMGVSPRETGVVGEPDVLRRGLAAFDDAVDATVLRAIVANESFEDYARLSRAVAPGPREAGPTS
jgi:alkanesulfonate monooxygenase SsuD/methylene tetrahydromethanopterin reductase-like flavin-dependent oxidoreductase (luciferase family)